MRKLLLVTRMDYWRLGAGARVRVQAVIDYLCEFTELTVAFMGPLIQNDVRVLSLTRSRYRFVALEPGNLLADEEYARRVSALCLQSGTECCIIDRVELAFLLDSMPPTIKILLDTHEIASDRAESMRRYDAMSGASLTAEEEFALFRRFDAVIAIQSYDFDKIRAAIGDHKTILAPHPALSTRKALRPVVSSIGFVASQWKANIDGLNWFVANVWPHVQRTGITLDLYGWIADLWQGHAEQGIVARGFVHDIESVYGAIDVVINPVRYGAGLKIKTAEALGHGLPLVTTSEGARGLESAAGGAFLVADDARAFAASIDDLIHNKERRAQLGQAAYDYALRHFTPQACFAELLAKIKQ